MNVKSKPIIFISYAREDQEIATRLYDDLVDRGLNAWIDNEEILPGQDWKHVIQQAIKECSHFIAIISNESVSGRGFVQKELKLALDILDETPIDDIYLIPVRIDDITPLDQRLRKLHRIDLFQSYEKGFQDILKIFQPEIDSANKSRYIDALINIRNKTRYLWESLSKLPFTSASGFCCDIQSSTFKNIQSDLLLLSKEAKLFNFDFQLSYYSEKFTDNNMHPYPTSNEEEVYELTITNISNELKMLIDGIISA